VRPKPQALGKPPVCGVEASFGAVLPSTRAARHFKQAFNARMTRAFGEYSGGACVWHPRGLHRVGRLSPIRQGNPYSDKAAARHLTTVSVSLAEVEPLKFALPL
jgi:hypothetical protein